MEKKTFLEWLLSVGQRKYYMVVGGGSKHMLCSEKEFKRQEYVFTKQGRSEQSSAFIVLCPESNCKVLIQSKGIENKKLTHTWKK